MKILIKPFALFSIVALLISCKDEQQVKVEKLTESYSKYLDSLTLEKSEEIVSKWNEIENEFNNKTTALKNEINQLDDKDDFEKKFAAIGIRYEDFKKDILVKKAEIDAKNDQLTRNKELFGTQFIHDDMKFEWENNKTASTAIKIAVVVLLVLGILQVFLTK